MSVFLPRWPTDRVRRKRGLDRSRAVLVVAVKADRQIVMDASGDALEAGVRPGMDVAHARALISGTAPEIAPHAPRKDAAALEALAQWAVRWSPMAAADPPDGLLLDITGCEHLFGGEASIVRRMSRGLRRLGFEHRIAVASTVGAAWGLARFADEAPVLIAPGREREAVAALPVDALRLTPSIVESLHEVDITSVRQLLNLPRATLPARYGMELVRRLDQALGATPEGVPHAAVSTPLEVEMELPGGTTQWEAVSLAVWRMLAELTVKVERLESGVRHLEAVFTRLDAGSVRLVVQVSRPTRNVKHLWALLRPKLDRLNLGFGVSGIALRAHAIARLAHEQASLIENGKDRTPAELDDPAVHQTIDTIANRLGRERVCAAECRQSHRPERAVVVRPLLDAAPTQNAPARASCERPSLLYPEPESVRVLSLSPDGPVLSLRLRGVEHRVVRSVGPERISGEWWRGPEPARDYFRVQDESGRWLWLFRERAGDWFVHGEWA